jgi:hypothetical protein
MRRVRCGLRGLQGLQGPLTLAHWLRHLQDHNVSAGDVGDPLDDLDAGSFAAAADADDAGSYAAAAEPASGPLAAESAPAMAPAAQLMLTASWTTAREVGLLLAALARLVPLPGPPCQLGGNGGAGGVAGGAAPAGSTQLPPADGQPWAAAEQLQRPQMAADYGMHASGDASCGGRRALLSVQQAAAMGQLLFDLQLASKHSGAVALLASALKPVAEQLLQCQHPALRSLPAGWLRQTIDWALRPGQVIVMRHY